MDTLVGIVPKKQLPKMCSLLCFYQLNLCLEIYHSGYLTFLMWAVIKTPCDISLLVGFLGSLNILNKGFLSCLYYMTVPYRKQITKGAFQWSQWLPPQSPRKSTHQISIFANWEYDKGHDEQGFPDFRPHQTWDFVQTNCPNAVPKVPKWTKNRSRHHWLHE